jgi:transposase
MLTLVAERPDLTSDEIVATLRKRRIASSRSAVWRFFARHEISFKKNLRARGGARPSGRGQSAPPLDARAGHV